MTKWQTKTIGELVGYEQPSKYLVKNTDYINDGTPVLTANKAFILGYTDEPDGIYRADKDRPVIIFDDFTTDNKFVVFNFKVKSSAIKILTTKHDRALPKFVHGAMQLIKTEITEHKRRFISEYQFHPVDTPELPEQERIVGVLEVWDEYIEKLEQKIALKEQLKKGLMQQLLTGKHRLPGFSGEWRKLKLKDISKIRKGSQLNKDTLSVKPVGSSTHPVINGGILPSGYTDTSNSDAGAITISEGGNSCGYVNYIKEEFWLGGHCYEIINNEKVDQVYLYPLLKAHESKIMSLRVGSGLPNIQKNSLENISLSLPLDKMEQEKIGIIMLHSVTEIEQLQEKLQELRLQKKYLLKNLITGTIRTPETLTPEGTNS